MSNVRDMSLAAEGEKKIRWCEAHMPLLRAIAEEFEKEKPLAGLRLALSVHMEAKTACLCLNPSPGAPQAREPQKAEAKEGENQGDWCWRH